MFECLEDRTVPTLLGQQLFPSDNPWNQNVAAAPVAANSTAIINNIVTRYGDGRLHPDFGEFYNNSNTLYGIPYNIVHSSSQARVSVVVDGYPDESDIFSVPIPANVILEGDYQNGPKVGVNNRGDSHLLIWDADTNIAYEFYRASRPSENSDGRWHASQETVWDMNANTFRTLGWTSADAAGLSLLAGLARPDEGLPVAQGGQGVINHAIRVTLENNIILDQYVFPASHTANPGNTNPSIQPAMGTHFRLKASVNLSSLNPQARVIATAMRDYGMIVADNGSNFFFSGATYAVDTLNQRTLTWNDDDIQDSLHGLKSLHYSDFEVVDLKPIVTNLSANAGPGGSQVTIVGQNFSGAAGQLHVWFGNTEATSVVYVDDSHLLATAPNGSGTVDVRVQSGKTTAANADNINNTIWGYGISAISPNARFTFGAATGNLSPFVVTAASASPATVSGTSTILSALGGDDGGEANLVYTWSVSLKPDAATDPTFSANGSNAAKSATATFSTSGAYTFQVSIRDAQGLTVSSNVNATVLPTPSTTPGPNAETGEMPTFTWPSVAGAVSYRIRIQNKTTLTYVDYLTSGNTLTLSASQALTPGVGYRWWVGSVMANNVLTWGTPLDFRVTPLPAPTLVSPDNVAVFTNDQPTLTWNPAAGATSYKVLVQDATTGKIAYYTTTGTSLTLTAAQALTPGHKFAWNVASVSTNGVGVFWGVSRTFTIPALGAPTLIAPANGAVLTTDQPTFSWNPVAGAASYRLYVADAVTRAYSTYSTTDTSWMVSGVNALTPGRIYLWRVVAISTNGLATTTSVVLKNTVAPLSAPVLASPTNNAILATDRPTFAWSASAGASSYRIWIRDESTLKVTIINVPDASPLALPFALSPGKRYLWFAGAVSTNGKALVWSAGAYFKVPSLTAPTWSISPPTGAAMPTFSWNGPALAANYEVRIDDLTTSKVGVASGKTSDLIWTSSVVLTSGHRYRTWLRAISANGTLGPWSLPLYFTA